jgi:hypothetical protein
MDTPVDMRRLGLMLAVAPRPPWIAERFAALDRLTAEGRIDVLRRTSRMEAEAGWELVLAAAHGREDEPTTAGTRRGAALSPAMAALRLDVLHTLRPGDTPLVVARRAGHPRAVVDRALRFLARVGAVVQQGRGWHPVQEGRPW